MSVEPEAAPGDGLVRTGVALFGLGLLVIVAVLAAYAAGARDLPVALDAAAGLLAPLGLACALAGLVRGARRGPVARQR